MTSVKHSKNKIKVKVDYIWILIPDGGIKKGKFEFSEKSSPPVKRSH